MIKPSNTSLLTKAHRLCLSSPLFCVSGITGSDLNQRVRTIMSLQLEKLGTAKKLLLTTTIISALTVPILFGQISASIHAQAATTGPLPQFEVATIKPNLSTDRGIDYILDPNAGRLALTATVQWMACYAYDIKPQYYCSGGPDWTRTQRFDILAKVDQTRIAAIKKMPEKQQDAEYRLMLRSLLTDRFKLQIKRETKEMPIYALVVAKNGPKLTPAVVNQPDQGPSVHSSSDGSMLKLIAKNEPMDGIAATLEEQSNIQRMVINKTGLHGGYDFELTWQREDPTTDTAISGLSIFTALQEQLGLKLEPQKGPADVLVIDHIEKPSAN